MMRRREKGSITLFFLFLVGTLLGAIGLSIYVGQLVERRMRVQIAADEAAFAAATQAAQGLNMIAANNLAMAASIHIAASVDIVARYAGLIRAATITLEEWLMDVARLFIDGSDTIQSKIFDRFAVMAGFLMNGASGLTTLNGFIHQYWLVTGSVRSLESVRLNLPGAVGIPLQRGPTATPKLVMRYEGIKQVSPANTICHSLKSSEPLGAERHEPFNWLNGLALTQTTVEALPMVVEGLGTVTQYVNQMLGIQVGLVTHGDICGPGLTGPLWQFFQSLGRGLKGTAVIVAKETLMGTYQQAYHAVIPSVGEAEDACCENDKKCKDIGCLEKVVELGACNLGLADLGIRAQLESCGLFKSGAELVSTAFEGAWDDAVARLTAAEVLRKFAEANGHKTDPSQKNQCLPFHNGSTGKADDCFDPGTLADRKWICPLADKLQPGGFCSVVMSDCVLDKWRSKMPDCSHWREFEAAPAGMGTPFLSYGRQAEEFTAPRRVSPGAILNLMPVVGGFVANDVKMQISRLAAQAALQGSPLAPEPKPERRKGLGFLAIETVDKDGPYGVDFERSRHFVTMVLNPVRSALEFRAGVDCPSEIRNLLKRSDGSEEQPCDEAPLASFGAVVDTGTRARRDPLRPQATPATTNELTGGVLAAFEGGAIASQWMRMQMVGAQAQVVFEPAADDRTPRKPLSQLFWPAWRPRAAKLTMMDDVFEFMRTRPGEPAATNPELETSRRLLE